MSESMKQAEAVEVPKGLICRGCGCGHFDVFYTRSTAHGITRMRVCRHCGRRMVTREAPVGSGEPVRGQYQRSE